MITFRRPKIAPSIEGALTLRTSDGVPLYTFPESVVTSMRHMETTLLYNDTLPPRIAVVAALRQEGVTYTTLALATTLAYDLAASICVIDLNWLSPGIHTQPDSNSDTLPDTGGTFKPSRRKKRRGDIAQKEDPTSVPKDAALLPTATAGLAAVLTQAMPFDEALVPTALPNLALLPAGTIPSSQRSALARGDALKNCIEQLSRRFDHILLDVPAILSTSDAIALASLGNACCLVVRQGITPINSVRRSLDDIKHIPMLGVILNQTCTFLPRWVRAIIPQE